MTGSEFFKTVLIAVVVGVTSGIVIAHINKTGVVKKLKPKQKK